MVQTEKLYLLENLNDKSCYKTSITSIPNLDVLGPMSKNQDTQIANLQMDIHVCVWNLKYINIYKAKLHVHWTIYVTVNEYTVTLTFQIYKQAG